MIEAQIEPERRDVVVAFAKAFLRRLAPEEIVAFGRATACSASSRSAFDVRRSSAACNPRPCGSSTPTRPPTGTRPSARSCETNTDDSPFLVDSVHRGAAGPGPRHPSAPAPGDRHGRATSDGRIERVMSGRDASHRESVMHFELDRQLTAERSAPTSPTGSASILHDVRLVVRDFEPMQDRVRHMIELARAGAVRYSPQEVGEAIDFLEWLAAAELRAAGLPRVRARRGRRPGTSRAIRAVAGQRARHPVRRAALGVRRPTPLASARPTCVRARIEGGDLLVFSKTNAYSTVHRRARMDYIGVRIVNPRRGVITARPA